MRSTPTGIATLLIMLCGALLVALLVSSCAATRLTSTWVDPALTPKPYRNLVVFGVAANANVRRAYEDSFVAALKARGVKAQPGHRLLPAGGLGEVQTMKQAITQSGADGVIITHLVGGRTETVEVAPGSYVNPGLYGRLYPYYERVYGYVTVPGYYAHFPLLQLETNLYNAAREQLVWSARSETMDPGSEKTTINEVIAAVTKGLAEGGFLPN